MTFYWSENNIRIMRSMAEEKHPARRIAEELGTSRNSVIGKCNRLNIKLNGRAPAPVKTSIWRATPPRIIDNLPKKEKVVNKYQQVLFEQRDTDQCAYVIGDVGVKTMCCGQKIARGYWCFSHALSCYQP